MSFLVTALAALIPLFTGWIWYNPKVFGNTWIKATGLAEEELRKSNMALIFFLTYVVSFLLAFALHPIVIHQFGAMSTLMLDPDFAKPGSEINNYFADFMSKYGNNYRTFKHGAFHGTIAALFFAMPIIAILALFERKSFKYVAIHTGYWMLTLALMGGVVCQFSK